MAKALLYFACISIAFFSYCQAATTKSTPLCGRCLPRTVTLTPSDGTPGSITPVIKMLPNTPQGCRQMRIICNTPAGYTKSNMVFNGTEPPKVGKNVNALISCFKASWHTTFMGSYIEILMINYSVFCLVAFMAIYSRSEAAAAKKPLREFKFHEIAGVFFATFSIFYTTKNT
ncbi:hypothetical protein NECAME_15845 [Necator americanus]|uniref:Uncharacterized protein n=1 Tax=Necator americanus TaxID=51031 RepID=W2SI33_NECAM|nr:hypothetical protein NECAME_15845 [Necator americanus]ETN68402.1 hypothetical protein NECAME_15845 [Necator americanus]